VLNTVAKTSTVSDFTDYMSDLNAKADV